MRENKIEAKNKLILFYFNYSNTISDLHICIFAIGVKYFACLLIRCHC